MGQFKQGELVLVRAPSSAFMFAVALVHDVTLTKVHVADQQGVAWVNPEQVFHIVWTFHGPMPRR